MFYRSQRRRLAGSAWFYGFKPYPKKPRGKGVVATGQEDIALLALDADSLVCLWCNEAYLGLLGILTPDVLGRHITEFTPLGAARVSAFRRVFETGRCEGGVDHFVSVMGERRSYEWSANMATPEVLLVEIRPL